MICKSFLNLKNNTQQLRAYREILWDNREGLF